MISLKKSLGGLLLWNPEFGSIVSCMVCLQWSLNSDFSNMTGHMPAACE